MSSSQHTSTSSSSEQHSSISPPSEHSIRPAAAKRNHPQERSSCPILKLPLEVIDHIASYLEPTDLYTMKQVNCHFHNMLVNRTKKFTVEEAIEFFRWMKTWPPDDRICLTCLPTIFSEAVGLILQERRS